MAENSLPTADKAGPTDGGEGEGVLSRQLGFFYPVREFSAVF